MATNFVDTSDFLGRALLVQGIGSVHSQYQNADKLTIHFQRKINKGGDVTKVLYPLDSKHDAAIVVFNDAKDLETTLHHQHVFHNVSLQVQRLPPVFRSVEVEIDPVYATLLPDVVQKLMGSQKHSRNPSFGRQNSHKLSFSCLSELKCTEEEVYQYIATQSETAHLSCAARGYTDPEQVELTGQERITCADDAAISKERNTFQPGDVDPEDFIEQPKTERDDSAAPASGDQKIEENKTSNTDVQLRGPHDQTSKYDGDGSVNQKENSIILDMFSYNFFRKHEKDEIERTLKKYNVEIIKYNMGLSVRAVFVARGKTSADGIQKAVDEFTTLYQATNGRLSRKTVECPPSISTGALDGAASKTSKFFKSNAMITKVDGNPINYAIVSSNDAEEVAQYFRKEAGIRSKKKLRTATPALGPENKVTVPEQPINRSVATNQSIKSNWSYDQNKKDSSDGSSALHSSQTPDDTFVTNEGMNIFICKGDITRQHKVHAIVNPTDPGLCNSVGASKAIETAAGPQLGKWCDQYMKKYPSLRDSECCVSPGYALNCQCIIHVVGPRTVPNSQQQLIKVLYQTFFNCLQSAQQQNMKSLAIPLIGSGGIGAPKKACADALVWALIDFSREPSRILSAVYLVNIDSAANVALKQSLESAFMESKRTISGDQHSAQETSTASVSNGRAAEMSPHGKPTYDIKDQPKHHSEQMPTEPNLSVKHPSADQRGRSTTDEGQSHSKTSFGAKQITEKKPVDTTDAISKDCPICLSDKMVDEKVLKCNHRFCKKCIDESLKQSHKCPVCRAVCAQPKGNQPDGTMNTTTYQNFHLPGYANDGTITIYYNIPNGKQTECHPNPGKRFTGVTRTAYLPDNQEGREVLSLLKKAFDAGLVFTVGQSVTSGFDDVVTWNDIHHKTSQTGGPSNYGYPDADYLKRVKEDLAASGIK